MARRGVPDGMSERHQPESRDCLWCKKPLPEPLEPTTQCLSCGRRNRRDDLAQFHTLDPGKRRLQTSIEAISAVILGVSVLRSMVHWRQLKRADDLGIVLSVIIPAVVAVIVAYQARYITKRRRGPLMHVSAGGCGTVALFAAGYLVFLGFTMKDLSPAGYAILTAAVTIVTIEMLARIRRAAAGRDA